MPSDNVIMLCAALYEFEWISITYDNEEQKWITYTLYIYCTWDYIVYVSLVNQIMLLKMGGAQMHCKKIILNHYILCNILLILKHIKVSWIESPLFILFLLTRD